MIQARTSTKFIHVLTWIAIISLTFGFCSSWSLHFVGMLSCRVDVPIGLNVGLTSFTGALAVGFTFISLGKDALRKSYSLSLHRKAPRIRSARAAFSEEDATLPLLEQDVDRHLSLQESIASPGTANASQYPIAGKPASNLAFSSPFICSPGVDTSEDVDQPDLTVVSAASRYGSGFGGSSAPSSQHPWNLGASSVDNLVSMATQGTQPHRKNVLIATFEGLLGGLCLEAVLMGLLWSLSLTCMHYGGLFAMEIPEGYMTLSAIPVVISALISWVVCIAGYIYLTNIEPFLSQQILFSAVAAVGIASMHFTGLYAATLYSRRPPSDTQTWPATLPIAIWSIAFLTCMLANGLLAHSATLSRNKLAEIVWTRRKLWRTLAEKELAEVTAATRSSFIASASHEIRTPLHHLQGYTDLLARSVLKDSDRQLLNSIQSATRTLSLITNNVLDWSKLESDMDALCRPTLLDLRAVAESIVHVLPDKDHDGDVEMLFVVAPSVPKALLLDETYIHRIFMNLLSNSLKFTRSGYIMFAMEYEGGNLITQVKDTGLGIPPVFLPRLFEPYSQAETRGTQRGTGLGLSIIKELLHKMGGNITVESHYSDDQTSTVRTGTTFTVTIPTQAPSSGYSISDLVIDTGTVAIFSRKDPIIQEGHTAAWKLSGCKVVDALFTSDLSNHPDINIIWTDAEYLQYDPAFLEALTHQDTRIVLVSYSKEDILHQLPALKYHFVLLQEPLLWHTFQSRAALALRDPKGIPSLSSNAVEPLQPKAISRHTTFSSANTTSKKITVLLVEDNLVNQKLGLKMLTTLGFAVIVASDGEEAIAQVLTHDVGIDVILMDQSMPNKDGVTATREIRQLEAEGKLLHKHAIIAVTAVVNNDSRASFSRAGADDFLSKPLSLKRLEQALAIFLHPE
ncbi:Histidine protein kinase [Lachnellula willkommii]|uniref:histidine kinase n=1 Tax=Lachnellula willkommii TaxID=215461 RepID=A0A559MFA4_9HELO|nr:Histidine protein kinase [Lachnellula willkommii]